MRAKSATAGAALCIAVAVFGAGVGAVFADANHASQKISSGSLQVIAQGPWASTDGETTTFADVGPVGSTFTTGPQPVVIKNTGTVATTSLRVRATADSDNVALHKELYVEVDAWQKQDRCGSFVVLYNGPLTGLEDSPRTLPVQLAPGHRYYAFVTVYAGANGRNPLHALDVGTGSSNDDAPSLTAAAAGGAITPRIHFDFTG
jgi:hypothetical protein